MRRRKWVEFGNPLLKQARVDGKLAVVQACEVPCNCLSPASISYKPSRYLVQYSPQSNSNMYSLKHSSSHAVPGVVAGVVARSNELKTSIIVPLMLMFSLILTPTPLQAEDSQDRANAAKATIEQLLSTHLGKRSTLAPCLLLLGFVVSDWV